jgi:hypothetical protein
MSNHFKTELTIEKLFANLEDVPTEQIPPLLTQLAAAQMMLAARLLRQRKPEQADGRREDRLLRVDELAKRMNVSGLGLSPSR